MTYAASSDVGRVRKQNEDSYSIVKNSRDFPVGFIVADGMGGHAAGEIASRIAVSVMAEAILACSELGSSLDDAECMLLEGLENANRQIIQYSIDHLGGLPSGTTLTAAFIDGPMMLLIHIGDSRAYICSKGITRLISRDHTLVAELVTSGVLQPGEINKHPEKNKITKALGFEAAIKPDVVWERINAGDRLLLCTDGLTEYAEENEIHLLLGGSNPENSVERLISHANEKGGVDNITVIVVDI